MTREEKTIIKEIILSTAQPPPTTNTTTNNTANNDNNTGTSSSSSDNNITTTTSTTNTTTATDRNNNIEIEEENNKKKRKNERTASMKFRAGVEIIRLLTENAHKTQKSTEENTIKPNSMDNNTNSTNNTDTTTTVQEEEVVVPIVEKKEEIKEKEINKLHSVSNTILTKIIKSKEKTDIVSILDKMKQQITSSTENPNNPINSNSINIITDKVINNIENKKELNNNIHNIIDEIFQKRTNTETSQELSLSLVPSNATITTIHSDITTNTNATTATNNYRNKEIIDFYRPIVEFPLSRFHDDKVLQQQKQQENENESNMKLDRYNKDYIRESNEWSDAGREEDDLLLAMNPNIDKEHGKKITTNAVAASEIQRSNKGAKHSIILNHDLLAEKYNPKNTSMLSLLRNYMNDVEIDNNHSNINNSTTTPMQHSIDDSQSRNLSYYNQSSSSFPSPSKSYHNNGQNNPNNKELSPHIERGGMLDNLRRQPKPDYHSTVQQEQSLI